MFKILIVDDEMLIRVGIKSLIDWEKHGFQIVGDASDGEMALKIIEKMLPDIILTDIIMPNMNGIKLIEVVKKRYPFIKILVLSCHNDYQYVRQAMKLGAEDYILKLSMRPEEILSLLHDVSAKIKHDDTLRNKLEEPQNAVLDQSEYLFSQLIDNDGMNPSLEKAFNEITLSQFKDSMILFCTKICWYNKLKVEKKILERSLLNFIDQHIRQNYTGVTFKYRENEFGSIIGLCELEKETFVQEIKSYCNDLASVIRRFLNISVKIGISLPFEDYIGIRKGYFQASEALQYSFYEEGNPVNAYSPSFLNHTRGYLLQKEDEEEFYQLIETNNICRIKEKLNVLVNNLKEARLSLNLTNQVLLEILHCFKKAMKYYQIDISDILLEDIPLYQQLFDLESLEEVKDWFTWLGESYCSLVIKNARDKHRDEIANLLYYLKSHYFEDINLTWAAKYVHMSESYLSRIFKDETNKNFIEYLTDIRLNKAAELLKTTDMPGFKIAQKVGYNNINYFGRIFKKTIGISPSQYREKFRNHNL